VTVIDEVMGLVQEIAEEVSPLLERGLERKVEAEIRRNEASFPAE